MVLSLVGQLGIEMADVMAWTEASYSESSSDEKLVAWTVASMEKLKVEWMEHDEAVEKAVMKDSDLVGRTVGRMVVFAVASLDVQLAEPTVSSKAASLAFAVVASKAVLKVERMVDRTVREMVAETGDKMVERSAVW